LSSLVTDRQPTDRQTDIVDDTTCLWEVITKIYKAHIVDIRNGIWHAHTHN